MELTPELTILMPCLNEAKTLEFCISKAKDFINTHKISGEIIVADNGSNDGSIDIAENANVVVVPISEKGYGAALAGGIAAARGKYVIMADSDASYDFSDLMPMLEKLRQGVELVVGNRFTGGIKSGAMPFLNRYLGNPVLTKLGKIFFQIRLNDFHCGLRGFNRKAILDLGLRTTGMEFASEMIVRASLGGLSMAEVPVVLWPDGRDRQPHLQRWRDGWRHLRFLLLYSPRWLYMYPGIAMIIAGVMISALLLPGPVQIGEGVGLDVHTLLVGSMSILVGVQSLTFGYMARIYAMKNGIVPHEAKFVRFMAGMTLEKILSLAAVLIFLGLCAVIWAAFLWSKVDFGALDYRNVMRVMIVAMTCIVGGLQLGFAAFFLGVMQIKQK